MDVISICIYAIIFSVVLMGLNKLGNLFFDDSDPDMDWHDNYSILECPHQGKKTDVVMHVSVTCETINTICADCKQVIATRTDCT